MLVKACNIVKAHNKLSLNMIIKTTVTTFETITIITSTVTTYKPHLCHSACECKVFTDFQCRTWFTKNSNQYKGQNNSLWEMRVVKMLGSLAFLVKDYDLSLRPTRSTQNLMIQFSSVAQSCPILCDPDGHSG